MKALIEVGKTKDEIKNIMKNDASYRAFIKNGDKAFDEAYNVQKIVVDNTNEKVDRTVNSLNSLKAGVLAATGVASFSKEIIKKPIEMSVKGAVLGATVDVSTQTFLQTGELLIENPNASVKEVYDNININKSDAAVSTLIGAVAPSSLNLLTTTIPKSTGAIKSLSKQLDNFKSPTKIKKIENRIDEHGSKILNETTAITGVVVSKTVAKQIAEEDETEE